MFTYIKLAILAIALIGGFGAGYRWAHNADEADKVKALAAQAIAMQASIDEYKTRFASLEAKGSAAVAGLQTELAEMTTDQQKLKKEIKDANTKYQTAAGLVVLPPALFTMEFGRVFNDSTSRADSRVPTGSPSPAGPENPDYRLSEITRDSILEVHDAIMQECGKYKAALWAIYKWDDSTHGN